MAGPNYTVMEHDWHQLSIIISDLSSRIIDTSGSFSDFINKDGSVAYTSTGVGFKNDMVDDLADATVSQNAIRDFVLEQVPDGTLNNQLLRWNSSTELWVATLAPTGLTSIGVTGAGTFGSIITGSDIGVAADTDLLQLAADAFTVNGDLIVDTDTLVVDSTLGRVGIGTASPLALLDSATGAGLAFMIGADVNQTTRTDNVRKFARFGMPHYDLDEEPILLFVGDSDGTNNILNFGGGSNQFNAATRIKFLTGANHTTLTGTVRLQIHEDGNLSIGSTSSVSRLFLKQPTADSAGGFIVQDLFSRNIQIYGTGSGGSQIIETTGTTNEFILRTVSAGNIELHTDNTLRMTVDGSTGDVAIVNDLTVSGDTALTGDLIVNVDSLVVDADTDAVSMAGSLAINGAAHTVDGLNIGSADGSDTVSIRHNNGTAFIEWNDGNLNLRSVETANSETVLEIHGSGTGRGFLQMFDRDDSEWTQFITTDGDGFVSVEGAAPGKLSFQQTANNGIEMFVQSTSGENQELEIYGFPAGLSKKLGSHQIVDISGAPWYQIGTDGTGISLDSQVAITSDLTVGGDIQTDGLNFTSATELTISSGAVTVTKGHHSIDTEGDAANDDLDTINGGDAGEILLILPADDNRTVRIRNGVGNIFLKHQVDSHSFSFVSPSGAGAVTRYAGGGWYNFSATDSNLDQGGTTQTLGTANVSYAAHASLIAAAAGTASGGSGAITIVVSGTSITDEKVRTTSDSEVIVSDITDMSTNEYFETTKKWIGQITYTLTVGGTGHSAFAADFNYGYSKYEDFGNQSFTVTGLQIAGVAGANDTNFNMILYHHNASGWTYAATGFEPGGTILENMNTSHGTEQNLGNGEPFAWKVTTTNVSIDGTASEGIVFRIDTSAAKAVESMTGIVWVHTAPANSYMSNKDQHLMFMKHGPNWLEL